MRLSCSSVAFMLNFAKDRHVEIVLSSVGYDVLTVLLFTQSDSYQELYLNEKHHEIEEIVVTGYDIDGWSRWGKYFHEAFLGLSENASKSQITNPDVLRFRYDKTDKVLYVRASAPIEILNQALGYKVSYDLLSFTAYLNENITQFEGSSFFEEIKNNRRVRESRSIAYKSSLNLFIRSSYHKTWLKDGYKVRFLKKLPNGEITN